MTDGREPAPQTASQGETLHEVYLALGSNLGNRRRLLDEAVRLIDRRVGRVVRQSSWIETEPWGFESAHRFLNGVVCCLTALAPHEVLRLTQAIERDMGRKSKTGCQGYADRTIDIDILFYDDLRLSTPDLTIPHPLMEQRDFVMVPLREILQ